jgi:glutaminyl-tRNA synthetase
VRLLDRLFSVPAPEDVEEGKSFIDNLNHNSLQTLKNCKVEPFVKTTQPQDHFQFERLGYFVTDKDSSSEHLVFNRTVSLKDSK